MSGSVPPGPRAGAGPDARRRRALRAPGRPTRPPPPPASSCGRAPPRIVTGRPFSGAALDIPARTRVNGRRVRAPRRDPRRERTAIDRARRSRELTPEEQVFGLLSAIGNSAAAGLLAPADGEYADAKAGGEADAKAEAAGYGDEKPAARRTRRPRPRATAMPKAASTGTRRAATPKAASTGTRRAATPRRRLRRREGRRVRRREGGSRGLWRRQGRRREGRRRDADGKAEAAGYGDAKGGRREGRRLRRRQGRRVRRREGGGRGTPTPRAATRSPTQRAASTPMPRATPDRRTRRPRRASRSTGSTS